jgi:hypothetical protein
MEHSWVWDKTFPQNPKALLLKNPNTLVRSVLSARRAFYAAHAKILLVGTI